MSDEVLAFLTKRRSIRKFTGGAVGRDRLEIILKATMAAPSANNVQPWRYVVVTEKPRIEAVCRAHPYAKFGVDAGAVIVPFGEREGNYYFQQDFGATVENILLAVAGLGLGATWCGMNEERQAPVKATLGLPERFWAFAVIPIGVPDEHKPPRTQYDPAKIHWEKY